MKIFILIALYLAVLVWGCRQLQGKHRNLHRLYYGCILGWCAYINYCGMTRKPFPSISILYLRLFQPAGEFIIQWLGG